MVAWGTAAGGDGGRGRAVGGKATNLALLWLCALAFATGVGAFLAGSPRWQAVVWLHATAGCTLVVLFYWKRRIIWRSVRRHGAGLWLAPSAALLALTLAALVTGLAWASVGLPSFGAYSGMTVHAALGGGVTLLLVLHAASRWPRVRRGDLVGRRALLRSGLLLGAGAALWRSSEAATALLGLSGAGRRFTGSRPAAGAAGNDFPASNWLTDDPEPLNVGRWRLRVGGHVAAPFTLSFADLAPVAALIGVLDCTGGWYAQREWRGVALRDLLAQAGVRPGARSVVVRASTGYWRRYTLAEAERALLATHAGDAPLSHAHGAPLRLAIPGKRGYEWVKWVVAVEVSTAHPLLKWPLPVS